MVNSASAYILKVSLQIDNSQIKQMEKKLDKSFSNIAKKFISKIGKGMSKAGNIAKIGVGLTSIPLVGSIVEMMLNPLDNIKNTVRQTLEEADTTQTEADFYNATSAEYSAIRALYERNGANVEKMGMHIQRFQEEFGGMYKENENWLKAYYQWLNENKNNTEELRKVFGGKEFSQMKDLLLNLQTGSANDAFYSSYGKGITKAQFEKITAEGARLSDMYDSLLQQARGREQTNRLLNLNENKVRMLAGEEARLMESDTARLSYVGMAIKATEAVDRIANALQDTIMQPEFAIIISGLSSFIVGSLKTLQFLLEQIKSVINGITKFFGGGKKKNKKQNENEDVTDPENHQNKGKSK